MSLPLLGAATGLAAAGGLLSQKDAAKNAEARTAARNAVLRDSLGRVDANAAENRGLFDVRLGDYAPGAQDAALTTAQDNRANGNVANITAADPNAITVSSSAPGAVRGEIAKKMLAAFQGATARARASGKLGGYTDAWLGNRIGVTDTANAIGTNNNFSQGQMRITPAMQDLAETATYKPPSLFPQLLQFAGNVLGGAAGRGTFGGSPTSPIMAPSPNGGTLAPMFPR